MNEVSRYFKFALISKIAGMIISRNLPMETDPILQRFELQ